GARATIDPDRDQPWLRRALPIVRGHHVLFTTFLLCTIGALLVQIATPRVLMAAIDNAVVGPSGRIDAIGRAAGPRSSLTPYVTTLLALAVARGVLNYVSRYYMFRTAYDIEYDLRTIVYEHLSRLSFSFYDRVQSGQLISRANSD